MRRQASRVLILGCLALVLLAGCGDKVDPPQVKIRKGASAPDFTLEDLDGNQVSLRDFEGQPVLIHFWASWCPSCRVEMRELEEIYQGEEEGLVVLAVDMLYQDDLDDVYEFAQEMGLSFPVLLDEQGSVAVTYRVGSLPTSVFVDRRGRIHLIQVGPMTRKFIASVLQEMP
ncbi:MAG: TlpA family protein disulfide reductase [Chloroflexia bacterium]|nr:TlpA family protein disulfide reductase [Chloroflexia bacterium]